MQSISTENKKIIEGVILRGYKRAAQSFSLITGQKVAVEVRGMVYGTASSDILDDFSGLSKLSVFQTDIIGRLQGAGYLICTEKEREAISRMGLAVFGASLMVEGAAVLKEIDNIISADMITELSNALKVNIYGDVPRLFEIGSGGELYGHLDQGMKGDYLLAYAHFNFEEYPVSPVFIWKMGKSLMEALHQENDNGS